jgi:hypothetical protein
MRPRTVSILLLTLAMASCDYAPPPTFPTPASTVPPAPRSPVVNQLQGTVRDTAGRPVAGAQIGAWSGPEAYATSDASGDFTITCCNLSSFVATDIFSATKVGYETATRTLGAGLNFVLAAVGTPSSTDRSSH